MSLWSMLETLLLGPLKLIFEFIFQSAYQITKNPGVAVIALSLVMNILVLPLYRRADAMQEQARDTEAKLHKGVAHIKKTFSGDERMMILQAYYRQNNYKPTDVLNGSVSLLLEIPFFMAAYQFLSHLRAFENFSFGPIKNMGAPDGLILIGGISINLLPVLMTLINVISSMIYLKGFPLKTKIQLYGMALFFLVFLYDSPSGLVFYWTLNNLFSLAKNIFYKVKNPKLVLKYLIAVLGVIAFVSGLVLKNTLSSPERTALVVIGIALELIIIAGLIISKIRFKEQTAVPNKKIFVLGGLFLTVFIGLLIPSNFIAASPQEFVDIVLIKSPLWYVASSILLAAGFFLVWMGVFYWLADDKWKVLFERIIWILCGVAIVNYMFFGTNLGIISSALKYENGLKFSLLEQIINVAIILVLAVLLYFAVCKFGKFIKPVLTTAIIAVVVMSSINVVTVNKSFSNINVNSSKTNRSFEISQNGKNVVVILLDRAMAEYVPYIFNEKPELAEKFDGFVNYSNTISFGGHTNLGAPALMGGYEYTPVEINKRSSESLVSKHNEALKVLPKLFSDNGYNVTVCDSPYANYSWIPDMSIYDGIPNVNSYITKGYFISKELKEQTAENNHRNFFCFSLMKSMPLVMQNVLYNKGNYNKAPAVSDACVAQTAYGTSRADGMDEDFLNSYEVLKNLDTMTSISENGDNFLFLYNDTTHNPILLQEPDYVPIATVDNTIYDSENADRFNLNGKTIKITTKKQLAHYQSNMAALIQLGNWFDYLRENGVYDNTKIILVADHGYYLNQVEELIYGDEDMSTYNPLLMVKDFGSTGFSFSDEFMTNADVPTLATGGVIENPVNPYTGKPINSDEKTAHDQFISLSHVHNVNKNNGNTYVAGRWLAVTNNIWDREDWQFTDKEIVLKEHRMP